MKCNACEIQLEKLLCDFPSKWREGIIKVICSYVATQGVPCDQIASCLSDEMVTLDPQCLVESQFEWDALTFNGKIQKIIDKVCEIIEISPLQVEDSLAIQLIGSGDPSDPIGSLTNPLQANLILDSITGGGDNITTITTDGVYTPPFNLEITQDDLSYPNTNTIVLDDTMILSFVSQGTMEVGSIPITVINFERDVQITANGPGNHQISAEVVIASTPPYNDNQLSSIAGGLGLYVPPYQPKETIDHLTFIPTTGQSINIAAKTYNIINPAGTLADLTLNLPATVQDGDYVEIKFTKAITTLAWSGGTISFSPTTASEGTHIKLVYDNDTLTWY